MVTLSQEVISVGVMVIVCTTLSLFCVVLWLVRCRRDQLRHKEERQREKDLDSYREKHPNKPVSKRAVADTVKKPKQAESTISIKSKDGSQKEVVSGSSDAKEAETMGQFEARVAQAYACKPLERIKEESTQSTPVRNKRLDTVSVTASFETLQRNDSKVNVFPADKMEEIDLNPGLNSVINLETI
ncbi:hypothetical protein RB195_002347 [Necator americanus]|uniref:Uncharacterized protein n=1 Tax=Necator americanus TaxID=51031 RepID=A0ABR1DIM8_NECAM